MATKKAPAAEKPAPQPEPVPPTPAPKPTAKAAAAPLSMPLSPPTEETVRKVVTPQEMENMKVLAHTQGVDQTKCIGQGKNHEGEACNAMLIVHQDGSSDVVLQPHSQTKPE